MEILEIKVNGFQVLKFVTKSSILDFVEAVDTLLQLALLKNHYNVWL